MLDAIKYNLANLTRFTGRDARQTFWFYVLFLVLMQVAVSMAVSLPMMGSMVGGAIDAARSGASEEAMTARMAGEIGGWMEASIWIGVVMNAVMVFLLGAAFVRRLHDSDHSGWWAALAATVQLGATAYSVSMMGELKEFVAMSMDPAQADAVLAKQGELAGFGLLGYIPLLIVVIFGVFRSTEGPNRYGEEPVRF